MISVSYGEFSAKFHGRFAEKRIPLQVSLEVTRRCPLICQHCYNNLPMGDVEARNRELTVKEYFSVLDELAELGTVWLLLTGGEILARKDFLEIYTYAKRKGFLISLFTNGILINESIADHLREFPPFAIEITLYGRTRETYEKLTRLPGSFERCLRGIRLLVDRRLPLKLKTVGTTINKHEILEMKQFVEQDLGLDFKLDSVINPRIDCSHSPLAVRLSAEEVVALDLCSSKLVKEYRQSLQSDLAAAKSEIGDTVYFCGGGLKSFAMDPFGRMSICVLSHQQTYDIRKGSVHEGWEHFLLTVRQQKRKNPLSKCIRCRLRAVCGMCPANGELENGDAESPVDFLCEIAHLRAMALGFTVPEHGDCEYCNEGVRRDVLTESARRIATQEIDPVDWQGPQSALPVLNNVSAAAGCGGCGCSHRS